MYVCLPEIIVTAKLTVSVLRLGRSHVSASNQRADEVRERDAASPAADAISMATG